MTGVVTILTCAPLLCRYRHAAVPGMISSNNSGNEQLKPRSSRSFFPDSMLLLGQDQYQSLINDWWALYRVTWSLLILYNRYGTSSQVWIMLYRASRDGYSAKHFHERCDEKGPTLALVKVIVFLQSDWLKYTVHWCSQPMVTCLVVTLIHHGPAVIRREDTLVQ